MKWLMNHLGEVWDADDIHDDGCEGGTCKCISAEDWDEVESLGVIRLTGNDDDIDATIKEMFVRADIALTYPAGHGWAGMPLREGVSGVDAEMWHFIDK